MTGGPLQGLRVVELAGLGAAPFTAMVLADAGADVIRVDRASAVTGGSQQAARLDLLNRGRRSIAVDLKSAEGIDVVLRLVDSADVLIEGFRPGVVERLGLGPEVCAARNARLVYGRLTGWGQDGPYAQMAGHDINYIAISGVLEPIGTEGGPPVAPLNLLGDFGGGGLLLAYGIMCALWEAARSGRGQVIDAAMVDGSALLNVMLYGLIAAGQWPGPRGTNILDSGSHFINVYECRDASYVAVAAAEPQFYKRLLAGLALDGADLPDQHDRASWPELKARFAEVFITRTREEWCQLFDGTDACVTAVLSPLEAVTHPHNRARETFIEVDGVVAPGPAPRFARSDRVNPTRPPVPGEHSRAVLAELGLDAEQIAALQARGAVVSAIS